MKTTPQTGRKGTQRERLLAGMMTAANRDGYAGATVSKVIAEARVSRPTFYDYFVDKDDCFLAALAEVQQRLLGEIREAVDREAPERAMQASIGVLIGFAAVQPTMARFLCNEPMAGGPTALDARDRGIADVEGVVEESYGRVDAAAQVPDFSARMLIGGVYRLLASRLRRGEAGMTALGDDLLAWLDSYRRPLGEHKWRLLKPGHGPSLSPFVPQAPLRAPAALPPGRPRISEEDVAENRRLRIMFAAAELAEDKGYTATTIADITKRAGLDGRAFYSLFGDKHDAFMAVHELGFQRVMEVTAAAFFAGSTWRERNWEAGRAFTQFLEQNPTVANVGFVEAYAVGPGAAQRLEDSHAAFGMLLQEGYQYVSNEARPPRVILEAIIDTIFETVYHRTRDGGTPRLSGLLGHLTFLVLSPFLGASEANAFVEEKLEVLATR